MTVAYEDRLVTLHHASNADVFPAVTGEGTADLAIVDPPYGDTALAWDLYAGSATTLIAARQCGRRAVGAEVDASYVVRAVERLSEMTLDRAAALT